MRSRHHHRDNIPDDFPYNPYWRDVLIASLSMTCRGEFNFVIASFGFSSGLIDSRQYASIVLAILVSAMVTPLILNKVIHYYNTKSKLYLETNHPMKRIGNTCDGYRPLFFAIQARTPVHWGMQEKFQDALETIGLVIIDHRYWHSLGLDAVNITEIFCQDRKVKLKVEGCFRRDIDDNNTDDENGSSEVNLATPKSKIFEETIKTLAESMSTTDSYSVSTGNDAAIAPSTSSQIIEDRTMEIRKILIDALNVADASPSEYVIQVSQWKTFSFGSGSELPDLELQPVDKDLNGTNQETSSTASVRRKMYRFHSRESTSFGATDNIKTDEDGSELHRRLSSFGSFASFSHDLPSPEDDEMIAEEPILIGTDLWETDVACHDVARDGYFNEAEQDRSLLFRHHVNAKKGLRLGTIITETTQEQNDGNDGDMSSLEGQGTLNDANQQQCQSYSRDSRRLRYRRHNTFDASTLESYNTSIQHDLEIYAIKERLHGYVRP